MKSAYISCPMTVSQTVLDEVIKLVTSYGVNAKYWIKGSHYDEECYNRVIKTSNAFIVILPNVAWSCPYDKMTSGSRKELAMALLFKKPIYIAYRNRSEGMGIYAAIIKSMVNYSSVFEEISGIASTKYNFKDAMTAVNKSSEEPSNSEKILQKQQDATDIGTKYHQELNLALSLDKSWPKLEEEICRQEIQNMQKAAFPAWINVNAIPPANLEKIKEYFQQTGMLFLDKTTRFDTVHLTDNRILLFC